MFFGMTDEQKMIVETTRAFVEAELYPHEAEVERTGHLRPDLIREIQKKAMEAGLYAANMPEDVGGGHGVRLKFTARDVRAIARLEGEGGPVGDDDV